MWHNVDTAEMANLATVDLKETGTHNKIQFLVFRIQQLEHIGSWIHTSHVICFEYEKWTNLKAISYAYSATMVSYQQHS